MSVAMSDRFDEIVREPMVGPAAWSGAELAADAGWKQRLSPAEIA